ncbi:MAG: HNH endonuclease [Rubricella sp.]
MAFGVFIHKPDSIYDDVPSNRYQFPKQYLGRAKAFVGDWIVYLEPSKVKQTRGYFAIAEVQEIVPDPTAPDMFIARITPGSYLDFGEPVAFRERGRVLEEGLLSASGAISGRARAAVRPISEIDFARIVERGLGREGDFLPRTGAMPGFSDNQSPFIGPLTTTRMRQLTSRSVRDRNFRKTVLRAYKDRCAFTGLRLINGGGRAEAEAAHIRPVDKGGPDMVGNGIALSGTVHWMFDRGLVSLEDDGRILVSRQVNNPDAIRAMLNPDGQVLLPAMRQDRPIPEFTAWHRNHCFKH